MFHRLFFERTEVQQRSGSASVSFLRMTSWPSTVRHGLCGSSQETTLSEGEQGEKTKICLRLEQRSVEEHYGVKTQSLKFGFNRQQYVRRWVGDRWKNEWVYPGLGLHFCQWLVDHLVHSDGCWTGFNSSCHSFWKASDLDWIYFWA